MIEGAGAGVRALKEKGKRIVYSTNNAFRPEDSYMKLFKEAEIDATFVSYLPFSFYIYILGCNLGSTQSMECE